MNRAKNYLKEIPQSLKEKTQLQKYEYWGAFLEK